LPMRSSIRNIAASASPLAIRLWLSNPGDAKIEVHLEKGLCIFPMISA
jgi:hypothetical protein